MYVFFFFNDTATTEIYTLSLHDALPISNRITVGNRYTRSLRYAVVAVQPVVWFRVTMCPGRTEKAERAPRSEEHTSELQSHLNLVCRLLLEKKKQHKPPPHLHR